MRRFLTFFRHSDGGAPDMMPPDDLLDEPLPPPEMAEDIVDLDLGREALHGVDVTEPNEPDTPDREAAEPAGRRTRGEDWDWVTKEPSPAESSLPAQTTEAAAEPAASDDEVDERGADILLEVEESASRYPDTGEALLKDLISRPDKYPPAIRPHVLRVALRNGGAAQALDCLDELSEGGAVTLDTAVEFIKQGYSYYVGQRIQYFPTGTPELADQLIANGQGVFVLSHPEKFPGIELDSTLVDKFIDAGSAGTVVNKIANNEVPGMTLDDALVERMIETQNGDCVMELIANRQLKGYPLDNEFANHLLDFGNVSAVSDHLESFSPLDRTAAIKFIQQGYGLVVMRKPEKFTVEKDPELFLNLVTYGSIKDAMNDRKAFGLATAGSMNEAIAAQIAIREPKVAAANLQLFSGLDQQTREHLNRELGYPVEAYPAGGNRRDQDIWFANNSFTYLSGPWPQAKIGQFMRSRLEKGIEPDMHEGSQWLSEFAIPDHAPDIAYIKAHRLDADFDAANVPELTMRDEATELELIRSLCNAPGDLRARLNLSSKPEMITQLFSSPEHQLLYATLVAEHDGVPLYKHQDLSAEMLTELAHQKLPDFWREYNGTVGRNAQGNFRESLDGFDANFSEFIKTGAITEPPAGSRKVSEMVSQLKSYGQNRKLYADDATDWLMKHATSPHERLTKVWLDRPSALINGVEVDEQGNRIAVTDDSARSIEQWQTHQALEKVAEEMAKSGELAKAGFTLDELMSDKWKDTRTELVRVLSARNTVEAMREMKLAQEKRNWDEKVLPAASVQVSPEEASASEGELTNKPKSVRSWTYEVLGKDDARGFTIGPDTGCCMTVTGASRSCINRGYESQNAGFVALYDPDHRLAAQSFWYVNPDYPDTLVMDNIEAVKGRNMDNILGLYRAGLQSVLQNARHQGNIDASKIRYVHIGEGYTKVDLSSMDRTDAIPPLDNKIYSDAHRQRLLLDMEAPQPEAS